MSSIHDAISNLPKERLCSETMVGLFFQTSEDIKDRCENYTAVMEKAREYGIHEQVEQCYQSAARAENIAPLWECPKPFQAAQPPPTFPLNTLPPVLGSFLDAVSKSVQVKPEMAALQLLSVLALCVQGKALIGYPSGQHTEPLNLYTLTIAQPGERKSGVFRALTSPLFTFQKHENERRRDAIISYNAEKTSLEKQLNAKATSPERMKEIQREIAKLKPIYPLLLNVTDATPEALAMELQRNDNRMGILDDEGGIFDILGGLYSSGSCNIDIFLKGYDGSPYTVIRRSKENITLEHPLLSVGLMAQQSAFEKAMQNPQFVGRGFIHRFLFAFPESCAGSRSFQSPPVPASVSEAYSELIHRLLRGKTPESIPVIRSNERATYIFRDYYDYIEQRMQPGGQFEFLKEWSNKQFARCMKIAGILHLCSHSAQEPVDEQTAQNAVNIAIWAENHALRAFGGISVERQDIADARYVLDKLRDKGAPVLKMREVLRMCRRFQNAEALRKPCELLCDYGYAKEVQAVTDKNRTSIELHTNPYVFLQ